MSKQRKRSRLVLSLIAATLVGGALTAAFWPRPVLVDMDRVTTGPMKVTIDEEGRTRVRDPYVVSTPVAGLLQRVEVEPGDAVLQGVTVLAHMHPTNPSVLDVRTREQANAAVTAAEAALRVARADLSAAQAQTDLAESELARTRELTAKGIASDAALDRAEQAARLARTGVDTAEAAISMREAEVTNARAQLIGFDDQGLAKALGGQEDIPLYAPTDGRVLQVFQRSETTLPAGAQVMEIGDITGDLEVTAELLSTDAVQVKPGLPVLIENWGGGTTLQGTVQRIDPFGVTKYSALGVEEQRVAVSILFTGPPEDRAALGHGYRVDVRIITWTSDDALRVPASALFRDRDGWAVFAVVDGLAVLRKVDLGANNGIEAQVLSGLADGDQVVIYPSEAVTDGAQIAPRVIQ
ncbi:efflux RND transporter periplasmic adaptor subunit [Pseudoprimorskyibacter insulae]|uniref:Efflux system component YknX n=1 Tax=Pseudoprimorskyibacter insulae TaxID=1695997 RepID=A0A2R8AWB8_9RHOB|nr:HlyD family efflux transporter periplasmic adaptor subunit [Pseudoprimorskyibacter insulae]SPF80342.1 Putative efflux system component YknX [Pseudoprimorskyibacter insulae]